MSWPTSLDNNFIHMRTIVYLHILQSSSAGLAKNKKNGRPVVVISILYFLSITKSLCQKHSIETSLQLASYH